MEFASRDDHRRFLASQASLPAGFSVGTADLTFVPEETGGSAKMRVTVIALDAPTPAFGAMFTRNAFPGAPVMLGRRRLEHDALAAIVVNNKVSNVGAPEGIASSERVCRCVATELGVDPNTILPSSTGVIGWRLPVDAMEPALRRACTERRRDSLLPAAEAIMTTDSYPKLRRIAVGDGHIVAMAKGAGMVEPHLATMLAFALTDVDIARNDLRGALRNAVETSFNRLSIDSDTSTSDSVVAVASGRAGPCSVDAFTAALTTVFGQLARDVVRNGEGVHHVLRVCVDQAPDEAFAVDLGRAIVNSPLTKSAICGNDANVGRLLQIVGKQVGLSGKKLDLAALRLTVGGHEVFVDGTFRLGPRMETILTEYLRGAELYASRPDADGRFRPPVDFPRHERCVEIGVHLGAGSASAEIVGADLSHEYIDENAYYRS